RVACGRVQPARQHRVRVERGGCVRPFRAGRIHRERKLRLQLQAARAHGVSYRRWFGWEPARTVEYVFDGDRVVGERVTVEPEWDDDSRAWAEALELAEADRCPGCGEPRHESTDPANENAYTVGPPWRCFACD